MHLPEEREARPVRSVDDLVDYFSDACKPRNLWRLGSEHEMIGVYRSGAELGTAPGFHGPRGIAAVLERVGSTERWSPVREGDNLIALVRDGAQITLEPGGQLEFAAPPVRHTREQVAELDAYLASVAEPSAELDIAWLFVGFRPFGTLDDVPWVPKGRYAIMRAYMPQRGQLAHEMMKRTATVQVNVDYGSVTDAHAKLRCAHSVTSILTAVYANSPIVDGVDSGMQSYRARVWLDTDPDRCGLLPFVFDDGDVFRAYAEWALDVPMFFVHRQREYRPANGISFRRFMRDGFGGERATLDDWSLHLSTLFPEARLKQYLEIRSCDVGPRDMIIALGPLCRALLYDDDACAAATALTAGLSFADRLELGREVPRRGLSTPVGATGYDVGELARELIAIADDALARIAPDERDYLAPLRDIVRERRTRADVVRDLWQRTGGDRARCIAELSC